MPSPRDSGVKMFEGTSIPSIEGSIMTWLDGDGSLENKKKVITQPPSIAWNGTGYVVIITYSTKGV